MLIQLLILYLLIINAAAILLMLVDKIKAKKNLWRIPEATLFLVAAPFLTQQFPTAIYLFAITLLIRSLSITTNNKR